MGNKVFKSHSEDLNVINNLSENDQVVNKNLSRTDFTDKVFESELYKIIFIVFEQFVNEFMEKFNSKNFDISGINPKTGNTYKFDAIDLYSSLREILTLSSDFKKKQSFIDEFDKTCSDYRNDLGFTQKEEILLDEIKSLLQRF